MVVPNVENGIDLVPYNYSLQSAPDQTQFTQAAKVTKKVLFLDELHASRGKTFANRCKELRKVLVEDFEWNVHLSSEKAESTNDEQTKPTGEDLNEYDILVVPPLFESQATLDAEAIIDFLRLGRNKALFIISNASSISKDANSNGIIELLENFGLQPNQLIGYRRSAVSTFCPHYITAGVRHLATIRQPVCFKQINSSAKAIAFLPESSEKPFLLTTASGPGRAVIIGDTRPFEDKNIYKDDNLCLTKNIFRWLTYQNFLDLGNIQASTTTLYGQSDTFSVELLNTASTTRLENLRCQLDSDASVSIDKQLIEIPPIPYGESTKVSWALNASQLGEHKLNFKLLFPEKLGHPEITLDSVATLQCLPDANIRLEIYSDNRGPSEQVEIHQSFDVEGIVHWHTGNAQVPLTLKLESNSPFVTIKALSQFRWRLKVLDIGNYILKLTVQETGQEITRLLNVVPSTRFRINQIERSLISKLDVNVRHHILSIWPDFDINAVADIPFRLLAPEDFIDLIYPSQIQEKLFDTLQLLRTREGRFLPLLDYLLKYLAPLYSPIHGCCIPYAPDLANDLTNKYPYREEPIAYNFLSVTDSELYGQTWMEGNIVALLLHEKYGHGFFYSCTKLGQQLAILYRHRLLRSSDAENLQSPYLRAIHKNYGQVIGMLRDSSIILNEGFATWLELTCLERMPGCYSETAHRRRSFLFQDAESNQMNIESPYFQKFHPGFGSKYQIAYDYLKDLQSGVSEGFGVQFALNAVVKAAEVDFGITEQGERVHFGLDSESLEEVLLDSNKGHESGADTRLRRIWRATRSYRRETLKSLELSSESVALAPEALHPKEVLSKIVARQLKW